VAYEVNGSREKTLEAGIAVTVAEKSAVDCHGLPCSPNPGPFSMLELGENRNLEMEQNEE
jgi:hypothetical protein